MHCVDSLVSVIIPCFERADMLRACLENVFAQTYRPIQVLVVDDCSTTDLRGCVESAGTVLGIQVINLRLDHNLGPGAAREAGRLAATGQWIAYLDSDDRWHPTKLEKQVKALRDAPTCGMCYCYTATAEEDADPGVAPRMRRDNDRPYQAFLPKVLHRRPWATAACMWTRAASETIGPWSSNRMWEDYEYDCRAGCLNIGITCCEETLCFVYVSPDSISKADGYVHEQWICRSLLSMCDHLVSSGAVYESSVASVLIRRLYGRMMSMESYGDVDLASRCLERLVQATQRIYLCGLVCRVMSAVPPTMRRARRVLASILERSLPDRRHVGQRSCPTEWD